MCLSFYLFDHPSSVFGFVLFHFYLHDLNNYYCKKKKKKKMTKSRQNRIPYIANPKSYKNDCYHVD